MKKITLVTGAGRGIGKEIALKFGKENHKIILLVFKKKQKDELQKILMKKKIDFQIIVGDLKDSKFIKSLNKKMIFIFMYLKGPLLKMDHQQV